MYAKVTVIVALGYKQMGMLINRATKHLNLGIY